jgi:hypothetical protein
MVEQQLFDVHASLDVKRLELEHVSVRLFSARCLAEAAEARVALAETPLAQSNYSAARRRYRELEHLHELAADEVSQLLVAQDALLAKLVG